MSLIVFFTPPSQDDLLSLTPPQLEHLLFSCPEPAYDEPVAIQRFWQCHLCCQPDFASRSRVLNPLWSVWHPTPLWRLILADPAAWEGSQHEAACLTFDLSGLLPGVLQLAIVLAAVAGDRPIQMVVGDEFTRPWITGLLPYAAIPIAACDVLRQLGVNCSLGSDPTDAIAFLRSSRNPSCDTPVSIPLSDNLSGWAKKRLYPALSIDRLDTLGIKPETIIDLSYLRDPQYFLDLCARNLPAPLLLLYNQLAGVWGSVQAPEGSLVLSYTYYHAQLDENLRQQCTPMATAFSLEPLPTLSAELQHWTSLLNHILPSLLLPLVAAWRQALNQLPAMQAICPAPRWIGFTDVVTPFLLALRGSYTQKPRHVILPHSFTVESAPYISTANRIIVDCPLNPGQSCQAKPIVRPMDYEKIDSRRMASVVPRKFSQLLLRHPAYENPQSSSHFVDVESKGTPLRIAVFLNQEYYYGYYYSSPYETLVYIASFTGLLDSAGLDYRISVIPKSAGRIEAFRNILLRSMIGLSKRISIFERNDISDSNPSWFEQFDINLFATHGSINIESAICRLPNYVFLGDVAPISSYGNYTAADLSPRFILPADQPQLRFILSPEQIRLEAERQFEHALNQADLFRADAPRLLRTPQSLAAFASDG